MGGGGRSILPNFHRSEAELWGTGVLRYLTRHERNDERK